MPQAEFNPPNFESLHGFDDSRHTTFRESLFLVTLNVATVISLLFSVLHFTDINTLNPFHANINVGYAFINALLILNVKARESHSQINIWVFLFVSQLTFTSTYLSISEDQLRGIWFYLLILVSYILAGTRAGQLIVLASVTTMVIGQFFLEKQLTEVRFTTLLGGTIIFGVLVQVFTERVHRYIDLLKAKNQQLNELAKLDPLTGILNSRYFHELGHNLISLAKRNQEPLSVLFLDLDNFKHINDYYGHEAGDRVLISVTNTIKTHLRASDVFARVGGEEFCIILPKTTSEGAQDLAEKLKQLVQDQQLNYFNKQITITTSIGVASLQSEIDTLKSLQATADKNLYLAKNQGRNKVVYK